QHRTKYLIVNGFLMVFDFLTFGDAASGLIVFGSHALSFSIYIALVWGLFLTLDGWQSRQTQGRAFEKKFRGWQRRKWLSQSVRNFLGGLFKVTSS
ncbi:MAG: 2TM domain-containing protein, partial [Leptolyngbyaceae bacterium]|nr:2TM domain-containing protein [Leptolyngbyaceae bacterium]